MRVCINGRYPWMASTGYFIIAWRLGVRYKGLTALELGLYSWAGILQHSQYSRISFSNHTGTAIFLRRSNGMAAISLHPNNTPRARSASSSDLHKAQLGWHELR